MRLEPAAPRSRVKHSTIQPLPSLTCRLNITVVASQKGLCKQCSPRLDCLPGYSPFAILTDILCHQHLIENRKREVEHLLNTLLSSQCPGCDALHPPSFTRDVLSQTFPSTIANKHECQSWFINKYIQPKKWLQFFYQLFICESFLWC